MFQNRQNTRSIVRCHCSAVPRFPFLLSTLGGKPRRLTACGEKDGQPAWFVPDPAAHGKYVKLQA